MAKEKQGKNKKNVNHNQQSISNNNSNTMNQATNLKPADFHDDRKDSYR